MKTIYLKCEVPDVEYKPDYITLALKSQHTGYWITLPCTEIHLPTDEEIDIMARQKPKYDGFIFNKKFGAQWLKKQIENQ